MVVAAVIDNGWRVKRRASILNPAVRSLDQILTLRIDHADAEGLIQITMKSILVDRHIDIDDIAVFEESRVGNTVTNDFTHRTRLLRHVQ
jgi:hypothetical protein